MPVGVDFFVGFLEKLSAVFGNNLLILSVIAFMFTFGIIYTLSLPRYLSIPFAIFAAIVVLSFEISLQPILVILIGIGLGFFLYSLFGR